MREFYLQNNLGRIFRFNYASGVLIYQLVISVLEKKMNIVILIITIRN